MSGRVPREANLVLVGVSLGVKVELVTHCPRIQCKLEERLIHDQIERVHHSVLALVDDPERRAVLAFEALRTAKVASNRLGGHKGAWTAQLGRKPSIERDALTHGPVRLLQCVAGDLLDLVEPSSVEVASSNSGGRRSLPEEAHRETKRSEERRVGKECRY